MLLASVLYDWQDLLKKTSLQLVDFANVYLAENMYQNWIST